MRITMDDGSLSVRITLTRGASTAGRDQTKTTAEAEDSEDV